MTDTTTPWRIYTGTGEPHPGIRPLPEPPPWRSFAGKVPDQGFEPSQFQIDDREAARARVYQPSLSDSEEIDVVNAALYLRRPLLLTGKPGTGKSTLAYSVAKELNLGPTLYWAITTRTSLADGLYRYDAIGRLQASKDKNDSIDDYIELGPLGTALLPSYTPRVLLIDEIDKSDIDLPNDLLNLFEEGKFEIPELSRLPENQQEKEVRIWKSRQRVLIRGGQVQCHQFPLIFMTSNGERDFPAPFLRRCLRLDIREPDREKLERIVEAHFHELPADKLELLTEVRDSLIRAFLAKRSREALATDQLLNAIHIALRADLSNEDRERLQENILLRPLISEG